MATSERRLPLQTRRRIGTKRGSIGWNSRIHVATQRMTSHLELFHAMREAIDVIRERSNAIEQAVARTQIYLDRDAMVDASTSLQDL